MEYTTTKKGSFYHLIPIDIFLINYFLSIFQLKDYFLPSKIGKKNTSFFIESGRK